MKRSLILSILLFVPIFLSAQANEQFISNETTDRAISALVTRYGENERIHRGVISMAEIWEKSDGSQDEFVDFAVKYYVADEDSLYGLALDLSNRFQLISGYASKVNRIFKTPLNEDTGEITPVEMLFADYNFAPNVRKSYFASKAAFLTILNFPKYSDEEKVKNGAAWSDREWGYVMLGDMFGKNVKNTAGRDYAKLDTLLMKQIPGQFRVYANNSTVELSSLLDKKGRRIFDDDIQLLFHWKMRDEIKMYYASSDPDKLDKQRTIYQAMTRFIDQTIPQQAIQGKGFTWNPYSNELSKDGKVVENESAGNRRYGYIRNHFIDRYNQQPDSALYFDGYYAQYGLTAREVEEMFVMVLSSPLAKEVGRMIRKKEKRPLETFDLWYTGFNPRSEFETSVLDSIVKSRYPDPAALQEDIPAILVKLGFPAAEAELYGDRIQVDRARANGHSAGAALKGDKANLRTNFREDGLDFGGYQTAMHELGHSVQQTISTYLIDMFASKGLPNSGIVESAAVLFEHHTWDTMFEEISPSMQASIAIDNFWNSYQMMGPALCELRAWQWMYHKKNFSIEELRNQYVEIAKDIWNEFYAPVFKVKDQLMPAVYNHPVNNPLYLSSYAMAHLIHIQIEDYIGGKDFHKEVLRIFGQGNKAPDEWMHRAVGASLSAEPLLRHTEKALLQYRQ